VAIDAGTRAGYDFVGWSVLPPSIVLADSTAQSTSFVMSAGSVIVTAGWSPVVTPPQTLCVTFNANGGSSALPSLLSVTVGELYGTLSTTHREGFSFDGWYTEPTGGVFINESTLVTETSDHTLYAHWTAMAYAVTVIDSYDSFAGANNYHLGDTVTVYAGSAAGFEFVTWHSDSLAVVFADASDATTTFIMPADNVTVTAVWRINSYSLTISGSHALNSGSGTHLFNSNVSISAGTYEGFVFDGWVVESGSVTLANIGAETTTFTMPASDVSITATWLPLSGLESPSFFTITFINWNGEVLSTQRIQAGNSALAPLAPSRAGYQFTGWSASFAQVSSDLVISALFIPVAQAADPAVTSNNSNGNADNAGNSSSRNSSSATSNNSRSSRNPGSTSGTSSEAAAGSSNAEPSSTNGTEYDSGSDVELAGELDSIAETEVGTLALNNSPLAMAAGDTGWAVANMICALLGVILAVVLAVRARNHKLNVWSVIAVVLGLVGLLVFFMTENVSGAMLVTDRWTTIGAMILLAESVSLLISLRRDSVTS
jgi:uncharacterized repeat protein (TIGR02543 family)